MNYTIENEHLKVEVSDLGAELQSIYGKKTNFEYLWQGNKEFWSGRAYNLFPICGRLTEGKYTYKGKTYEMNLHGFSRKTTFTVIDQKKDQITLKLVADEKSLQMYPFDFCFTVKYSLDGATLKHEVEILNNGKEKMLFGFGGHPGFNVPLIEGAKFSDHYLEFSKPKKVDQLVMSETCYYTNKTKPFALENDKILRLNHNLFDNDAIFLSNMDNVVTLKCDKTERFVKVEFNDMTHLGFWHTPKTEAPFVCIEPWHGIPADDGVIDNFETKREIMSLDPNKKYNSYIYFTVNE